MPLIFFLVVVWGLYNAAVEGSARAAARPKSGRAGLSNYLDEVWHGFWEQKAAGLAAARAAKSANPGQPVRFRDRWSAAKSAMSTAKTKAVIAAKRVIDPVEVKPKPESIAPIVDPAATAAGPEGGTVRFTDSGRERYDEAAKTWRPIPDRPAVPAQPDAPAVQPSTKGDPDMTAPTQVAAPANPNTGPTGEAVGVVGGAAQAQQIKLAVIALKERTLAQIAALQKSTETLAASGASMEIDPKTAGEIARAQEALAALSAAMTGTAEEVCASMKGVEDGFSKHLPGVEFNAAVGGMANRPAYSGN